MSDLAGIYILGVQPGTVVRNNVIHDVNVFVHDGHGIYLDEGASDIVVENNVVYRTQHGGLQLHYGRNNVVRNNVFALGREYEIRFVRAEDHLALTFEHNIVYVDAAPFVVGDWPDNERSIPCGPDSTGEKHKAADCRHYQLRENLYFGTQQRDHAFAGVTFAQWRTRNNDSGSAEQDPQFENARRYDFRLRPTSPALKMGFKTIQVASVGIRTARRPDDSESGVQTRSQSH